jgi:rhodanese-related sulfurtransferase
MNIERRLGIGALVAGLAAALVGSPYRPLRGHLDVEQTARLIMDGGDHVSALQLAAWIKERKPGLRVIDVRPPDQFSQYAIPTAENLPLDVLLRTSFSAQDIIVLYSEGGAHAAQAWALLRAMGVSNTWFIAGGLADWHEEVHAPVLARDATAQQVQAFEAQAELSRYFGGVPSIGDVASPASGGAVGAVKPRRRGC